MAASRVEAEGALAGRAGIITGATGGIGQALAAAFRGAGARVALLDLDAQAVARDARRLGGGAIGLRADVTNEREVEGAVERAVAAFGRLDFLVNNAGIRFEIPFLEHGLDAWRKTMDVNLTGAFLCARAAARRMVEHDGGKILNVASIAAACAVRARPAYVASKAGLLGLTRAIAWELGPRGVYCNAILAGVIETPLTAHYFEDEARARVVNEATALGRRGLPSDIVGPALFLCSPASDYVQGAAVAVDGGWLAGKGY